MLSGRFNFKINERFDLLSLSYIFRDLYTRKFYIIEKLDEEQEEAWKAQKKKR